MKDVINIDATPCLEPCAQVGSPDYEERALAECERYIALLRKVYGVEPEGCRLYVKANNHDYGVYHEVALEFNTDLPVACRYAMAVECGCETWEG